MLTQRIVIALIIGPVLLTAAYFGGWLFFAAVAFLMIMSGIEYANIMRVLKHQLPLWLLLPGIALLLFGAWQPGWNIDGLAFFLVIFAGLIYCLRLFERGVTLDAALDWFALVAGIVLLGWVGGHFFHLRNLPVVGAQWTMLGLLSIWSADMGAFAVGKWLAGRGILGRHALAPRLSPKKTVEGYVGGIIIGTAVTISAALILDLPVLLAVVVGLAVSIFGLFGDLSISLLKREAGLKDSGKIFPGHGGALDRSDSLIWAIAIVYYLVLFLGPILA
ncbi:putative Phosphatidate cytidylyltransferase [Candidatus Promineifilum breve]|uniref:Phosphatidate cytidylyltransferase n=1 Tax=Candidatus Promineifilum breve TaxID=1806508 RepID=A0A160T3B1_9CHLR|nr:phosphatidate cytidylyltransferase [Candidatus Promineifilum breve]CUS03010.2 putative Phosphatidate cytidylyltransferase [Candidatus Promineifilum breve]